MKCSNRSYPSSNCLNIRRSPRWPHTSVSSSKKILKIRQTVAGRRSDEKRYGRGDGCADSTVNLAKAKTSGTKAGKLLSRSGFLRHRPDRRRERMKVEKRSSELRAGRCLRLGAESMRGDASARRNVTDRRSLCGIIN